MKEPTHILRGYTRVRTHETLGSTGGFLITARHLSPRKPNMVGAICGIVEGHGGDVYYVAHIGDPAMAVYGFDEFELEPVVEPVCQECHGSGIDFPASAKSSLCTPCDWCKGTATAPPRPRPTAWERLNEEPQPG
jgi:hypothetical protein